MNTGERFRPVQTYVVRLASSVLLTLLVAAGLLMVPVSCMCGSSVPHGHSLFQLPSHRHGNIDSHEREGSPPGHGNHDSRIASSDADGIDHSSVAHHIAAGEPRQTFSPAASNALEKHDGAVVQAPPSSSFGHPIAMTQPSTITLADQQCERLVLPSVRTMTGLEQTPETPPPRAL